MAAPFNLKDHGITVTEIHRNLPPSALYEHAILYEKDASIAENGALVAYSGVKTGRSPKDKRVVKHPDSEANVWWGILRKLPVWVNRDLSATIFGGKQNYDFWQTIFESGKTPQGQPVMASGGLNLIKMIQANG